MTINLFFLLLSLKDIAKGLEKAGVADVVRRFVLVPFISNFLFEIPLYGILMSHYFCKVYENKNFDDILLLNLMQLFHFVRNKPSRN